MTARRWPLIALLVVTLGGCGSSDEDEAADAVRAYFGAIAEGEYDEACSQLAASARRDVADYAATQLPEVGSLDCEEVMGQIFSLIDEDQIAALEDVEVTEVTIDGDSAIAEVEGATEDARLRRVDGEWKFSELDFGGG